MQVLRAVAAWMVVAHHLRPALGGLWAPLGETLIFAAGVDIFFVLSGFVMAHSHARRPDTPLAFWRRRLARVAPLYWLTTLALLGLLALGLRPVGVSGVTVSDVAAAFLFLADQRADGYPGPILGVGWTLNYEMFFYALFGVALVAGRMAVPLVIAAIAGLALAGVVLRPEGFAAQFYLAPILLEFAAGAALGWAATRLGAWRAWMALGLIGVGVGGLMLGAAHLAGVAPDGDLITPGGVGAAWRVLYFGVPAALIIAGAAMAEAAGAVCRRPALIAAGGASYAVYLLHLPLLQAVAKITGGGPALIVLGAPVVAAAAAIAHRWVERPAQRLLAGRRRRPVRG